MAYYQGSVVTAVVLSILFFPAGIAYVFWRRTAKKFVCSACGNAGMVSRFEAERGDEAEALEDDDEFEFSAEETGADAGSGLIGDGPSIKAVRMISVPGAQGTSRDTPLVFSAVTGNKISVGDADADSASVKVVLRARRGFVRLHHTAGLSFALGNGRDNLVMHFSGTVKAVNAALEGLRFTPTTGFVGKASLWVSADDLGDSGVEKDAKHKNPKADAVGSNAAEAGVAITVGADSDGHDLAVVSPA